MILLIDNYDSFTYNLYQMIGAIDSHIRVIRNDAYRVDQIQQMHPSHIILSPGPGRPEGAGVSIEIVQKLGRQIPIFGVCLGHQAICQAFGGKITYAPQLMHGKVSQVDLDTSSPLFRGLEKTMKVGRYHSLIADRDCLPDCLKVIAQTSDHLIMALQHIRYPIYGVQFHPESILTHQGAVILKNFIEEVSK